MARKMASRVDLQPGHAMTAAVALDADLVVRQVQQQLVGDRGSITDDRIRAAVAELAPLLSTTEVAQLVQRVNEMLFGFGPLEPLLADTSVAEVMINGAGRVWVERHGAVVPTDVVVDDQMLRVVVDRIVAPLGLRVDRTAPFVDARLADGSRVNIAVPPLAVDGPYVTIRRFRAQPHQIQDFCDPVVQSLMAIMVERRWNVIVSGGTGSGKTSLLNAIGSLIPSYERVITIEDAAELRFPGDHTVRLEARPANAEGIGQVTIRTLLRNALRMRPDRLVIGEVRGAEALDMIQAMNTGHAGSLSTCHANSPRDALRRIESIALMAELDLPHQVIREQLLTAVDAVVHVVRDDDGSRRIDAVLRCDASEGRLLVGAGNERKNRWTPRVWPSEPGRASVFTGWIWLCSAQHGLVAFDASAARRACPPGRSRSRAPVGCAGLVRWFAGELAGWVALARCGWALRRDHGRTACSCCCCGSPVRA